MIIAVHDANILIDLVELKLLPPFFEMGWKYYTTDLILEELIDEQQSALAPYIENQRLIVHEISGEEFSIISDINAQRSSLSEQDCSAFYQARKLEAILLTSDGSLRKFAKAQEIEVHGHLWIFDQMIEMKVLHPKIAIEKLDELCLHVNRFLGLPEKECDKRKEYWATLIAE